MATGRSRRSIRGSGAHLPPAAGACVGFIELDRASTQPEAIGHDGVCVSMFREPSPVALTYLPA